MNTVELIINMACKFMERILQIEFATIPEDRQRVIAAAASQELIDWLEAKGMSQKERVLTRFFITAATLHVLPDHLPQLLAHLRELTKEEEEHGI